MRLACAALSSWFEKDAVIVTPTPFLAGVASEQFARERLGRGVETWERPAIFGFEPWLMSCWQEARYASADVATLLAPAQERVLWQSVIEQEHPHLFDISATVRLARQAAMLLAEWEMPSQGELWNEHLDAQQFQHWNRLMRRKCRENGWLTRADLLRQIPSWISGGITRPKLTVFVGFDPTAPALKSIQRALGALSVQLPFDEACPAMKALAKSCDDFGAELEFAARRLRRLFEKPRQSLALFVPDLAKYHAAVAGTLNAVFFPSAGAKVAGPQSLAAESLFHIRQTGLLVDHPLVSSALLFMNLALARIDHADAGAVLRSPFLAGAAAERHLRALADIELRKRRELDVSLGDVIRVASRGCPILISRLIKLRSAAGIKTLPEWSEFISDLLGTLGWPGEVQLTAREEQVVEQWKDQLSTLSGLGLVSPAVTLESALGHLHRLLSVPLEKGDLLSPIQVLDAEDARGLEFDAAIAVGMSDETWPPALRISPLVPLRLQRAHQVPGSTPHSAREERARLTQAVFRSAAEVVVTFKGRLASSVERFVRSETEEIPVWEGRLPRESFSLETLEQLSDGQAPPFVAKGEMRGGTGIIKAQSQCPFRAFAEYRLNARSPEDASFGFDARERGGFVHKALENVWNRLESQTKLLSTPPDELRVLVRDAVAHAVETKETYGLLHQLSAVTERERLEELILEWLSLERARSEPFTVETVEQVRKYEVPGLSVQLRVDRIDRLKNGNLVLIDYKSGAQTRGKLVGERPPEPQLLVYAASVGAAVDGIFFGQLKPREVKAVGFSRKKQFKGQTAEEKKDWNAYIEASRGHVEKLAKDFVRGVAEVDHIKGACDYCASKPFCRVNEGGAPDEEEE